MKNIMKFASAVAVVVALSQSVQAVTLNGTIGMVGRVTYDTGSAGTATEVTSWINPTVSGASGSFGGLGNGTAVTFANPVWVFVSGDLNPFWSVGGFTFELQSSHITSQGGTVFTGDFADGFVVVSGIGIVTAPGFDPTPMSWSFSSQDPKADTNPDQWTFSVSTGTRASVPDGGSTVMLLGLALSGAALLKKKLTA